MSISFTEAIGGPVPATEIEINLQGAGGLPDGDNIRNILVLAERVAAGTSAANEVRTTAFADADEARAWFGAGSNGDALCQYIFDYRNGETGTAKAAVYGAAVAEVAGTAAELDLTFATNASASGTWTMSLGGFPVSFTASTGDTPTEQGVAYMAAFNALPPKSKLPLTVAAGAAGVVVHTWGNKGAFPNNAGVETLVDPSITTTAVWEGTTFGAGAPVTPGAGLVPTLTTVIANMEGLSDIGQIVTPWSEVGNVAAKAFAVAGVEVLIDHVNSQSNAVNQIPCSLIMSIKDTAAAIATVMGVAPFAAEDDQRCHIASHPYSVVKGGGTWEGELSAQYAALRASETHLARSFDGLNFRNMQQPEVSDNWTAAEQKTLLEAGTSPVAFPSTNPTMRLVRDVMCRTSFGVVDGTVMDTLDYTRAAVAAKLATLRRMSIVGDDADIPPVAHITKPSAISALIHDVFKELERTGYLVDVDDNWDNVIIELSGTTVSMSIPAEVVPQLHNIMIRLDSAV